MPFETLFIKMDFRLDIIGLAPAKKYSIDPMLDSFMYQDCKLKIVILFCKFYMMTIFEIT